MIADYMGYDVSPEGGIEIDLAPQFESLRTQFPFLNNRIGSS